MVTLAPNNQNCKSHFGLNPNANNPNYQVLEKFGLRYLDEDKINYPEQSISITFFDVINQSKENVPKYHTYFDSIYLPSSNIIKLNINPFMLVTILYNDKIFTTKICFDLYMPIPSISIPLDIIDFNTTYILDFIDIMIVYNKDKYRIIPYLLEVSFDDIVIIPALLVKANVFFKVGYKFYVQNCYGHNYRIGCPELNINSIKTIHKPFFCLPKKHYPIVVYMYIIEKCRERLLNHREIAVKTREFFNLDKLDSSLVSRCINEIYESVHRYNHNTKNDYDEPVIKSSTTFGSKQKKIIQPASDITKKDRTAFKLEKPQEKMLDSDIETNDNAESKQKLLEYETCDSGDIKNKKTSSNSPNKKKVRNQPSRQELSAKYLASANEKIKAANACSNNVGSETDGIGGCSEKEIQPKDVSNTKNDANNYHNFENGDNEAFEDNTKSITQSGANNVKKSNDKKKLNPEIAAKNNDFQDKFDIVYSFMVKIGFTNCSIKEFTKKWFEKLSRHLLFYTANPMKYVIT
jgi:hypothetical protein